MPKTKANAEPKAQPTKSPIKELQAHLAGLPEPSATQMERIAEAQERRQARSARLRIKVLSSGNNTFTVSPDHSDTEGHAAHFNDALGTSSHDFSTEMLQQLSALWERTRGLLPSNRQMLP
jgi:hypothetical protein